MGGPRLAEEAPPTHENTPPPEGTPYGPMEVLENNRFLATEEQVAQLGLTTRGSDNVGGGESKFDKPHTPNES